MLSPQPSNQQGNTAHTINKNLPKEHRKTARRHHRQVVAKNRSAPARQQGAGHDGALRIRHRTRRKNRAHMRRLLTRLNTTITSHLHTQPHGTRRNQQAHRAEHPRKIQLTKTGANHHGIHHQSGSGTAHSRHNNRPITQGLHGVSFR